jgi:hypothetical protein
VQPTIANGTVGSTGPCGTVETGTQVERLALFIVAGVIVGAFQIAFQYARPGRVWPVAIVVIFVGAAIAIWFDQRGFTSRTPYPFALMVIVPGLVVGGITQLGTAVKWPWPVTTLVAGAVGLIAVIPMWFAGCLLAAAFRLPGCHF